MKSSNQITQEEQDLLKEIENYEAQQRIAKLKERLAVLKNPQNSTDICNCAICQNETKQIFKIHIANYEEEGINPRVLSRVCRDCKENKVIQANFYCPLTSDGYDGWDTNQPKFNCLCPVPLEKK
jgi:hypothetical protein